MTVGDQHLPRVEEGLDDPGVLHPPHPRRVGFQVRRPPGWRERRLAFVEEEQRLELGVGGTKQAQTTLDGLRMRALVGDHHATLVGLGTQGGDDSLTPPWRPVPTREALLPDPDGRLLVAYENTGGEPIAVHLPRLVLVLGQGEMGDVVGVAAQQNLALVRRDDVIRRSDHRG